MLTASLWWATLRIALAILLDTGALVLWDVGTRSPLRVLSDVRRGARRRETLARGSLRFIAGSLALVAAIMVAAPVANVPRDLTVIASLALVTALVLEALIGPDLRARRR